jgi:hypothetical protein
MYSNQDLSSSESPPYLSSSESLPYLSSSESLPHLDFMSGPDTVGNKVLPRPQPINLLHRTVASNSLRRDQAVGDNDDSIRENPSCLVCKRCWDNIFTSRKFAKACWVAPTDDAPGLGFRYQTYLQKIQAAAKLGCNWCQILL